MYKVGDEVWVKVEITEVSDTDTYPYKIVCCEAEFADSNWVKEGAIVDKSYEQGLADAWELAKKLCCDMHCGGYSFTELESIFDTVYPSDIFEDLTAEEALAKIEAYEREKEIKVGDEVEYNGLHGVVTKTDGKVPYVMWSDGSCGEDWDVKSLNKTGKHIDIEGLLRQIGE